MANDNDKDYCKRSIFPNNRITLKSINYLCEFFKDIEIFKIQGLATLED